ncbi:cation:proton antiporter [Nocardioides sp. MAH-18]|uniref:Cation:proton antiporter n=1 Tax=Nocardioides agri TaxID=2682843 RepID=A0A6L6XQ76_9ACTN|nr:MULTISPECIES: cation:proton antiporter [unclassified Nocardioides]MBA2953965.1 cation:proton antiporter [Nocardioides sp. CGMCC 1.13656]MVQ48827.1 cation:proton antiporter [Nocardioides sp. MAH-18]
MPGPAESIFWITLCAVIAPLIAGLVLRGRVSEVVLLLALGVLIGPNVLDLAVAGEGVTMLRELGLGLLFLLAGYEIEVDELVGAGGRRAALTWLGCFGAALGLVFLVGLTEAVHAEVAVAIALTSTALGALLPILKDAGLLGTRFGRTLMNHGAYGELGPVVAMAVLMGTRGVVDSLLVLAGFFVIAVLLHRFSNGLGHRGALLREVRRGAETSRQIQVRLVVLLLVTLITVAELFELDVVLGAFAAGFVLRGLLPEGHEALEHKLEGLAFGLLIPIFFVTSGMAIDPEAVAEEPIALVTFVALILLVRGGGVLLATRRDFPPHESAALALFAATGLPIIVAVTTVAVHAEHMSATNASVLVAGGAVTVLICPLLGERLVRPSHPEQVTQREAPRG